MAHICRASLVCHAEVNFTLVSMGDDVTRSRSIMILYSGKLLREKTFADFEV